MRRPVTIGRRRLCRAAVVALTSRDTVSVTRVFEHVEDGIHSELWVYVALNAAVKFSVLRVQNRSGRPRRLSATGYVEWVLGDMRDKYAMHIATESDPVTGALLARNPYNTEFQGRVTFYDTDATTRSVTGDRTEFLGRNGNPRTPAAMKRSGLSGRLGPGLDPCAAIQVPFELAKDETREVIFRLGSAQDAKSATELVQRHRGSVTAATSLDEVRMHWHWTLGKVQVNTPDAAVECIGEWLADVPDHRSTLLGAQRVLPVWRRFRFPRPVAGFDGDGPRQPATARGNICC